MGYKYRHEKGQRTYKPCVFPNCILPRKVYFDNDGLVKGYLKCCEEHFGWNHIPGPNHPNATKQGRRMDNNGYIQILDSRKAIKNSTHCRYIFEHRWVVEQSIGRPLGRNEIIHHMNGVRHDNRLENLCLLKPGEKHESRTYIKALQKRILELESLLISVVGKDPEIGIP